MLLNKKEVMYKQLVEKLYDRCQRIQAENERCVMRVNGIKKIVRRRNHDVELLKRRLDKHGDNWRSVPMVAPHPKGKTEQKRRGPKPKNKQAADETGAPGSEPGPNTPAARKPRKQKAKQPPINPNPVIAPPHLQPPPQLLT
ncbi:TCF3 fusion partner homolog [Drosophila sechellia]|uniref:GM14987 n=1 Tax=Drosophila sechellia TaxID=7238 RepID=B4IFU6_DROSE|nr:TCF3 fusion partner homolog [Drosophila sechellia]EDW46533.1 GM14987 [Drosophila sechellia]